MFDLARGVSVEGVAITRAIPAQARVAMPAVPTRAARADGLRRSPSLEAPAPKDLCQADPLTDSATLRMLLLVGFVDSNARRISLQRHKMVVD